MEKTQVEIDPKSIRKIFSGWDTHGAKTLSFEDIESDSTAKGSQNLLVFINAPANVTAQWKTQYYLNVISEEAEAKGEGWYDFGRLATVSLKESSTPPGMWTSNKFDKWTGDIDSETSKARVIMNGPKTVIAEFKEDNTPGIINSVILIGVAAVGAVIYKKTHKAPSFGTNEKKEINGNKPKAFESFFNTRTNSITTQGTSNVISKPSKLSSIMSWLLGKN